MKYLTHESGASWSDFDPEGLDDELTGRLESLLLSDSLVVLAGLGASLCIVDDEGNRLAPTMPDLWKSVRSVDETKFDEVAEDLGADLDENMIEALLSRCHASLQLREDAALREFVSSAERSIAESCDYLESTSQVPVHAAFLRKIARRPVGSDRVRIFTTNYDLAFEYGASAAGIPSLDGFSPSEPRQFDAANFDLDLVRRRAADGSDVEFIPGVHYLYKLHGSVDWSLIDGVVGKSNDADLSSRCLIFPRDSKFQLSYEPPFFDLLAALQAHLRSDNLGLLVVGFGFADAHIVRPLLSAVHRNVSMSAMFVDPRLEEDPPAAMGPISQLILNGDPRLTLVAARFEELVPAIPTLQPRTHLEVHRDRSGSAGLQ